MKKVITEYNSEETPIGSLARSAPYRDSKLRVTFNMENEILDFINRRWKKDSNFLNGNCYWFAYILVSRFKELEIYYLPITGHFIAGNGDIFFDWQGKINLRDLCGEKPMRFDDIKKQDSLYYNRLIRDCVL